MMVMVTVNLGKGKLSAGYEESRFIFRSVFILFTGIMHVHHTCLIK